MLRLKRKVGQKVVVDRRLELTVLSLGRNSARLELRSSLHDIRTRTLTPAEELRLEVPRGTVRVSLTSVERGEACLTFKAPRNIEIERPERLTGT